MPLTTEQESRHLEKRHRKARIFAIFCAAITWSSVLLLAVCLYQVSIEGFPLAGLAVY